MTSETVSTPANERSNSPTDNGRTSDRARMRRTACDARIVCRLDAVKNSDGRKIEKRRIIAAQTTNSPYRLKNSDICKPFTLGRERGRRLASCGLERLEETRLR